MTPGELLDVCDRVLKDQHIQFVQLTIPYRKHRSARIRLLPGVLARVVGSTTGENVAGSNTRANKVLLISVAIADIKRYLIKHLSNIEAYAVELAEAGKHDEAQVWFDNYIEVRDRLGTAGMWRSRV